MFHKFDEASLERDIAYVLFMLILLYFTAEGLTSHLRYVRTLVENGGTKEYASRCVGTCWSQNRNVGPKALSRSKVPLPLFIASEKEGPERNTCFWKKRTDMEQDRNMTTFYRSGWKKRSARARTTRKAGPTGLNFPRRYSGRQRLIYRFKDLSERP